MVSFQSAPTDRHFCRTCTNLSVKFCTVKKEKVIDDVVRRCADYSPNGLEVGAPANTANPANSKVISCNQCLHFKCFNQHGSGAGICNVGVQPNGNCWWADSLHECEKFDAAVEWVFYDEPKPDALLVECFTPKGTPIVIEATSPEHAAYLIRMNPQRTA